MCGVLVYSYLLQFILDILGIFLGVVGLFYPALAVALLFSIDFVLPDGPTFRPREK